MTKIFHGFRRLKRWQQLALIFTVVILAAAPFAEKKSVSEKPTPTPAPTRSPQPILGCAAIGDRVYLFSRPQAILQGCDFSNRQFERASDWGAANLIDTDFTGAILHFADFSFANLTNVNFSGAYLEGADFTNANVKGANFEGAILRCIKDEGIKSANWSKALNVLILSKNCSN